MNYFVIGMIIGITDSIFVLFAQYEKHFHQWLLKEEEDNPRKEYTIELIQHNAKPWWNAIRHAIALTLLWPLSIIITVIEIIKTYEML